MALGLFLIFCYNFVLDVAVGMMLRMDQRSCIEGKCLNLINN